MRPEAAAAAAGSSPPSRHPPALKKCIALLRLSTSIPRTKQIHARSIRSLVPVSSPLLAKHLIFSLLSLSLPSDPTPVLPYSARIFAQLDPASPNIIFTVNTLLRAHSLSSDPAPALPLFSRFRSLADTHTYPFVLKSASRLSRLADGRAVHSLAVRDGMAASCVFVQNSLVHFYSACGVSKDAYRVFDEMPARNVVTWNSVINGFSLNSRPNEALTLFRRMVAEEDAEPDGFTMVSLFCACAELGALALGRRAHVYSFKRGLCAGNAHVGNAMIDLYAKCGCVSDAEKVFDEMGDTKNVVSWTSLIVGLAVNGFGGEALELFGAMEGKRLRPTEITLVGVLYACSHCGLVDKGFSYFAMMK